MPIDFQWKIGKHFAKCSVTPSNATFEEMVSPPEPPMAARGRILVVTGVQPGLLVGAMVDEWKIYFTGMCIFIPASGAYVCYSSRDKREKGRLYSAEEVEEDFVSLIKSYLESGTAADLSNARKRIGKV